MALILAILLIAVLLGVFGFAIHLLWWIALIVVVLWLAGFLLRTGPPAAGGPRARWYRW